MAIVQLKEVTMAFPFSPGRSLTVLEKLSLSVEKGSFVALLGPSGCGKSTLLNLLAGQLTPTAGQVVLGEGDALPSIGLIPQGDTLLPWRKVVDNVALALELRGVPKAPRREQAKALMAQMGLAGFEDSWPHQLSGGMKKRAAIARILAIRPELLMMDEPFAPLDAMTRERLQEELLTLWEKTRCTILYVTHDITEAITLAQRVVLLGPRPGHVVGDYPVDLPYPRRRGEEALAPRFLQLEKTIRRELAQALEKGESP